MDEAAEKSTRDIAIIITEERSIHLGMQSQISPFIPSVLSRQGSMDYLMSCPNGQ